MRILLTNPATYNTDKYALREIPLGLAYIQSALQQNGYECDLFDFQLYHNFDDAKVDLLNKIAIQPDLIGVTCNSFQFENCKKVITILKEHFKNSRIVVGGIHATFVPDDFNDTGIDYIIQGEGENAMLDLISIIANHKNNTDVSNQRIIRSNNFRINSQFLNEYLPDYDQYIGLKVYNPITVITSRGCLGNCKFCSSPNFWGHCLKYHSIDWLKTVLEQIALKGIKKILFVDDSFFYPYNLSERFSILKDFHNQSKITFAANSRIIDFPIERTKEIKNCGIDSLSFGIEAIVNGKCVYNKTKNIDYVKHIIDICKENDIKVRTSWILGLPEMTNDVDKYTNMLDSMTYLNPNELSIHWLVPYPGSYYYDKLYHLFNFLPSYSYNSVPYGLYNYLDDKTMIEITKYYQSELVRAGYSEDQNADYYYYLPSHIRHHLKRSFY